MKFLVQGSSRSWAGDVEHCMNSIDGKAAIYWTIKRIYDNFDDAEVIIIAPEYDKGGKLESLKKEFLSLEIFYGYDESPLSRMIEATKAMSLNDHFIRINALNFQFEIDFFNDMMKIAEEKAYDCIKLKDDYPVHFVGEVYKVSALKKLKDILSTGKIKNPNYHEIHPKFLLMRLSEFNTYYYTPKKEISDEFISHYIKKMEQVMYSERQNIEGKNKISSGDQLTYHYELAEAFLNDVNIKSGTLLDIACGTGHGATRFNNKGYKVYAADYDELQIEDNKKRLVDKKDIVFKQENIMDMSFESNIFDAVFSMETIEHVDPDDTLKELKRVIKDNGFLIISTPQNSTTQQCINPQHLYEYSLLEITKIVEKYFKINKIIGLKAGKIYFDDDPIGANTVIFAQKVD